MSLLDDAKEGSVMRRPTCSIAGLDADLRAEIEEALTAPGVTDKGVAKALEKREIDIGASTLGRHRRRDCKCP